MSLHVARAAALELTATGLRRRCEPGILDRARAVSISEQRLIGQGRAAEALAFGLAIPDQDFNVYVAGPPGTGKGTAVRGFLERAARERPVPGDWCYVHNFSDPARPRVLQLVAGQGRLLRNALRLLIQTARREIPRAFETEDYIGRREAIVGELNHRREQGLSQLTKRAQSQGFLIQATPMGLVLVPVMGDRPLTEEALAGLPVEMRQVIERNRQQLEGEIRAFLKEMRAVERETRERLESQDREVALHAVGGLVDDLVDDYTDQVEVSAYLAAVREGILADIALFRSHPLPADGSLPDGETSEDPRHAGHERIFRKYEINVVVDNNDTGGAPVVVESNPTHPNLLGRIEREAVFGALVTDHTLISPGALHRANGGHLVLRVEDVLRAPLAWEALKRTLREGEIDLEDLGESLGLTSTRGLRPDTIPLRVKVFLLGDRPLYHLLYSLDPDFRELFKVRADFDTEMDRTPESEAACAAFLLSCAEQAGLALDDGALARLIDESSRVVADQRKLSTRFGDLADLVREAAHWARVDGAERVGEQHVRRAVEQRIYRSAMVQERLREMIARGILLVRPEGQAVGQVAGLAVAGLGPSAFGHPVRITATVGAGREGVLDIERQAELGGRIHSKGILILGGYLADAYAQDKPLSLSARLVFEQSYEEVEGDSASLAELLALLSRLAEVPLFQGLAVTGSVNQRGQVQAIGGVNEKIEGFFDTCVATGLSGDQGVIIPVANVEHLMLRDDVVEAAAAGRFHVYAVGTVDQALDLLANLPAAARPPEARFEPPEIHARVNGRLSAFAAALRDFAEPGRAVPSADGQAARKKPEPKLPGREAPRSSLPRPAD